MECNDPDYQTFNANLKIKEEKDITKSIKSIQNKFDLSFQGELKQRQSQLEIIENKLVKARKTLHLLRYALVTAYYKNQEFEVNNIDDDIGIDPQSRIHPALKKLLGNNLDNLCSANKRKRIKGIPSGSNQVTQESGDHSMKLEPCKEEENICNLENNSPENKTKKQLSNENTIGDSIRNRKQIKKRVIVGNISKWNPSDCKDDKTTHKWMVYVRTPKECSDISTFVDKVLFYLHPSYRPHDIIELRNGPFHLTRRGWGEFPLRLRIYFKNDINKPVDIIHNLKLDKSYTGRQTLGNETIVDLSLFENKSDTENESAIDNIKQDESLVIKDPKTDHENVKIESHPADDSFKHEELDKSNSPCEYILLEHSYTLKPKVNEVPTRNQFIKSIDIMDEAVEQVMKNNNVSNFLQQEYFNQIDVQPAQQKRKITEFTISQELVKKPKITNDVSNCSFFQHEYLLKVDSYKIHTPIDKFINVVQILPYLLRRLPIITELAEKLEYKCLYPYAAKSIEEYASWTDGKRASCEWSRAKSILKVLRQSEFADSKNWNMKNVIYFARSHGFTPLANYKPFGNVNTVSKQMLIVRQSYLLSASSNRRLELNPDVPVDVIESVGSQKQEKCQLKSCDGGPEYSFVRQAALDVGVILKPEEIIPNVYYNSTERVLLEAVRCLAENLIRNARSKVVMEGKFNENTAVIHSSDVKHVLQERPDFNILLDSSVLLSKY